MQTSTKIRLLSILLMGLAYAGAVSAQVLTLEDAVEVALEGNADYRAALNGVELAALDLTQAESQFKTRGYSSFNSNARTGAELGSYYQAGVTKRSITGSELGVGLHTASFGSDSLSELRFSYTLPFFKNPAATGELGLSQAQLGYRQNSRLITLAAEELIVNIASAYYQLVLATQTAQLSESEINMARRFERTTRLLHRNGRASNFDIRRAELNTAQALRAQDAREMGLRHAENQLRLVLGWGFAQPLAIDPTIPEPEIGRLLDISLEELLDRALESRIELTNFREQLEHSRRRIRSADRGERPNIDISLQYSLIGEGRGLGSSLNFNDQRFGIGVSMDMDFRRTSRIKQRRLRLQYDSAKRAYDQLADRIRADTQREYFLARENITALAFATRSLKLAEQQQRLMEIRYRNGGTDATEVLRLQHEVAAARNVELNAKVNLILTQFRLHKANGVLREQWKHYIKKLSIVGS